MLWAQHTLLSKRGLGIQLFTFQTMVDSSSHALLTKSIQMRWQLADIHNFVGILCLLAIVWLTPAGRILNSAGDSWSRHTVFYSRELWQCQWLLVLTHCHSFGWHILWIFTDCTTSCAVRLYILVSLTLSLAVWSTARLRHSALTLRLLRVTDLVTVAAVQYSL